MKILQRRELVEFVTYERVFDYEGERDWGFRFECDARGNVDASKLADAGRASLAACMRGEIERIVGQKWEVNRDPATRDEHTHIPVAGTGKRVVTRLIDRGVDAREHSYWEPAIGECACGARVTLDGFTCTCHRCGTDYNSSGQRLAPRAQWGEETGETAADILRADFDD
jgi:hypothetical protein